MNDRRTDLETRKSIDESARLLSLPIVHYKGKVNFINEDDLKHYMKISLINNYDKILNDELQKAFFFFREKIKKENPFSSESFVDNIIDKCGLVKEVSEYVVLEKSDDGMLWGNSPFVKEPEYAFVVHPVKQIYYCYSTQKGGNVIKFIQEIKSLDFGQATDYLCNKYNIEKI